MFQIGVKNVWPMGAVICIALVAALLLGQKRSRGIAFRRVRWATALLAPCAMFGGHLLYSLVTLADTLDSYSFWHLFAFWKEGAMMTGGALGVLILLCVAGGKERGKLLEAYAPSGALMAAACAIGKGMMGQGYGEYLWDESFFWRFPFMVYDADYEAWGWALFMLEALIAILLFVMLLKNKPRWQGDSALLFLGLYFSARIVLESLRRDDFLRWGFVRVEELAGALWVLGVLIAYCVKAGPGRIRQKAGCFAVYAAMFVLVLLLEFATEGRIPFLFFLETDQCYLVMALCCAVLMGCVCWMRSLTKERETNR